MFAFLDFYFSETNAEDYNNQTVNYFNDDYSLIDIFISLYSQPCVISDLRANAADGQILQFG